MRVFKAVFGLGIIPFSALQILIPNTGPADPNQWIQPRLQTEQNQVPTQVGSANQSGPSPFTPTQPENKSQTIVACLPNVPQAFDAQREPQIKNDDGVNPAINRTPQQFCDTGITPQPLIPTAPTNESNEPPPASEELAGKAAPGTSTHP